MRLSRLAVGCLLAVTACTNSSGLDPGNSAGNDGNDGSTAGSGGATLVDASGNGGSGGDGTGGKGSGGTGGDGTGGKGGGGKGGGSAGAGGAPGIKLDGGTTMCLPVCQIFCQYGNVLDDRGCPTCACKPAPEKCPALGCAYPQCPGGVAKDANGCDTCRCADTGPCDAKSCPAPAPGAPNFLCPDGKTLAGPACQRATDGTCRWAIVSCPAPMTCPCSDGAACVRQIGGPAVPIEPPPDRCVALTPGCLGGPSRCSCIPNEGKCMPSPTINYLCICDNGQR